MNALVLHLGGYRAGAAFPEVDWLVAEGFTVTLVVSNLPEGALVPDGVEVLEVADLEQVEALVRMERFVVVAAPAAVMRRLRTLVTRLGAIRGVGRPFRTVAAVVVKVHAFQYRASRGLHGRWLSGPYRAIRSLWLWRVLERSLLDVLLDRPLDLVVCGDRDSVSTAWHIARRRPDLTVTYGVNKVAPLGATDDDMTGSEMTVKVVPA